MTDGSGVPGELLLSDEPVVLGPQAGQELIVLNTGDRPVQVGSHYHLAAANPALELDRNAATGMRLAVPAGTSVRFEPGVERVVRVVPLGGARTVPGLRLDAPDPNGVPGPNGVTHGAVSAGTWTVERSRYAKLYGPTEGDRVRLADTDLLLEITEDRGRRPRSGLPRRAPPPRRCTSWLPSPCRVASPTGWRCGAGWWRCATPGCCARPICR